jgi:hypothetical protein
MPASYEFVQDVAIVGRLAVGQGCPVDPKGPRIWANGNIGAHGDISATGNLRVDRTIASQDLGLIFGPQRQTSEARLKADNSAVLGLDGALRVRDTLGIGTPPGIDPAAGQLVVQGTGTTQSTPLQTWRTADGNALATVDGVGRIGVGTATPSASLSVNGTFLVQLSGLVKGYDDRVTLTGDQDTRFDAELKVGSSLSIPGITKAPRTFRVVAINGPHELRVDRNPGGTFDDQKAFTDAPLLTVRDGLGVDRLNLASDGTLTLANGATSISGTGVVTARQFVGHGAVFTGMIVMWAGDANALPDGWALCDGGTYNGHKAPDLRSRFLVGAGSEYQIGQAGDPDTHTHQVAPPSVTATTTQTGAHTHKFPPNWYLRGLKTDGGTATMLDVGSQEPRNQTTSSDGIHTHQATVTQSAFPSGNSSGQNRPKWYALAFIIKLPVS